MSHGRSCARLLSRIIKNPRQEESLLPLKESFASKVFTLTSDNGKEFARHQEIAKALRANFYFAHPYSSWERGLNENTNGLIRQHFPQKHDFTTITEKNISIVIKKLNNKPRYVFALKRRIRYLLY